MATTSNKSFKRTARGILVAGIAALWLVAGCGQTAMTEAEHLERGVEFREQGDLRASVIELKNALQKNPSSQEGRWQLGLTYLEMQDGTQAEAEILRARELGMDQEQVSVALARARVLQGEYEQALADLGEGVDATDRMSLAQAHVVRGLALLGGGQGEAAGESFQAALEQVPDLTEAMVGMAWTQQLSGDTEAASDWLEKALAQDPQSPEALRTKADMALASGDLEAADASYGEAIRYSRNPFELHLRRAMVRVQLNDLDAAGKDLEAMRAMSREHPMTMHLSGLLHSRHGRYAEAQADFETVLSSSQNHLPTIYLLGAAHYAQGHWNQAESQLRRFLRDNPGAPQAVMLLARVHVKQERVDDAISLLETSIQADATPDPALSELLSALYLERGETERGLETLQVALRAQPDSATLQEMLGMALMRTGERDAGMEAL
ncbi:MAG TPA: tetratricopeptide repeat protein, partial [Thioalkalivibrio sp.]|nr:tetratricopeptide repeat protein [Thioalkalivibrio sp.]